MAIPERARVRSVPALAVTLSALAATLPAMIDPAVAAAQEGSRGRDPAATILSDRPGLGDGAHVLGDGVWQLEAGVSYDGGGPATLFSVGQGLVRVGLAGVELRLYPNSLVLQRGEA